MAENRTFFSFRPGNVDDKKTTVVVPIPIDVVTYKPQENAWRACSYCATYFPDGKGIAVRGCVLIEGETRPAIISFHNKGCLLTSIPYDGHRDG